jgi:chromatin remodeling complex protein RSC6
MAPKKATSVVASAPVVPEPVKKADAVEKKTVAKKAVAEPVVAAVAPAATTTDEPIVVSTFDELVNKINSFASILKETQTLLKALSKEYERMKKTVDKTERKRANARTNPNGFAKPAKITDEMHEFLGVPKGTEISRTDVTRRVNAYIKEHNLYNPTNKRIILPDDKLRKILGVKPDQEVTFFNLQRFLSASFVKKP